MRIKDRTALTMLAATVAIAALAGVSPARAWGQGVPSEGPQQEWVARYGGPYESHESWDVVYSLGVSPDGSTIFVTGGSNSLNHWATVAYAASSGNQLWKAAYYSPSGIHSLDDHANSLAVSPDGSTVFVTGQSYGWDTGMDYATVAYAASSGAQLWAARFDGPGQAYAQSLAVSSDGLTVFVTGESEGAGGSKDYTTIAYSASGGAQLWLAQYNGPANGDDIARSLALSPDGSKVFVMGQSNGPAFSSTSATVAYAATSGVELWAARSGPWRGRMSLDVSSDGSTVLVTDGGLVDYATVAYDASSGTERWAARYNGPEIFSGGGPSDTAISRDGSTVFITGSVDGSVSGTPDYATVAYALPSGDQLWVTHYTGLVRESFDNAWDLALSPDGSTVFVTGFSDGTFATVAYAATSGAEHWAVRYSGARNDWKNYLAVSPDGSKVFVSGSVGSGTYYYPDYATVTYRATTCASGKNEAGPVSRPLHDVLEPQGGPGQSLLHGASCAVVAGNGL